MRLLSGKHALITTALLFLLAGCGSPEEEEAQVTVRDAAPDTAGITEAAAPTFQDLQGNAVKLSDFRGKKVFLNYWATWCAPCIREIPSILRAQEELGDDYVFLLASDEKVDEIRTFVEEQNFSGNFVKLNGFFASHGVEAVPSTVLYNKEGEEVNTWLGAYEWDSPEMLTALRQAD